MSDFTQLKLKIRTKTIGFWFLHVYCIHSTLILFKFGFQKYFDTQFPVEINKNCVTWLLETMSPTKLPRNVRTKYGRSGLAPTIKTIKKWCTDLHHQVESTRHYIPNFPCNCLQQPLARTNQKPPSTQLGI